MRQLQRIADNLIVVVARSRRAFSMVELLVATVCLSITAIGLISALGFVDTQNAVSRQRILAFAEATSEMERYQSKAYYGNVAAGVFTTNLTSSTLPQPATLTTTVTATADNKVFLVTAQVNWTVTLQSGVTTRSVHLDSAVRNNDAP